MLDFIFTFKLKTFGEDQKLPSRLMFWNGNRVLVGMKNSMYGRWEMIYNYSQYFLGYLHSFLSEHPTPILLPIDKQIIKYLFLGIFFVLPCIESYQKVDLRTITLGVPPQEVLTKDSVTVSVDAVVYYRVSNATVSVANVENAHHSTRYPYQQIELQTEIISTRRRKHKYLYLSTNFGCLLYCQNWDRCFNVQTLNAEALEENLKL